MELNRGLIEPIFAIPMYRNILSKGLTKEQISFIEKNKKDILKNESNAFTKNVAILEDKIFKDLKKELLLMLKEYYEIVLCCTNDIKPYITQSWLNFNNINEYHHQHYHENSLISGVFYVQCLENEDSIKFLKNKPNIIEFTNFKNYNLYNSSQWEISIRPGLIVLFPSSITHKVDLNKNNHTRISLAFNVFVTGTLGDKARLTQLEV